MKYGRIISLLLYGNHDARKITGLICREGRARAVAIVVRWHRRLSWWDLRFRGYDKGGRQKLGIHSRAIGRPAKRPANERVPMIMPLTSSTGMASPPLAS
jgi:hypothetical protein